MFSASPTTAAVHLQFEVPAFCFYERPVVCPLGCATHVDFHAHVFRFDRTTWQTLIQSIGARAADPAYPITWAAAGQACDKIRAIAFAQGWM